MVWQPEQTSLGCPPLWASYRKEQWGNAEERDGFVVATTGRGTKCVTGIYKDTSGDSESGRQKKFKSRLRRKLKSNFVGNLREK